MRLSPFLIFCLSLISPFLARATSVLEASWQYDKSPVVIDITEFNGKVSFQTESYYPGGQAVQWYFQFSLPEDGDAQPGLTLEGRVRSQDGISGCLFSGPAKAQLQADGSLKIHYPLLTHHRENRWSREDGGGYYRDRYHLISTECVIDQKNWVTARLTKVP